MPEHFIPIAIVFAIALLIPRQSASDAKMRPVTVLILMGMSALLVSKYLWWRLTTTMPEPGTGIGQLTFSWFLLIVELALWTDTFIFFLTLSRSRENSGQADLYEAELRALPESELPHVDVFIATYNEDMDVLEKTIVGASSLDWPSSKLTVYILDDGKRDWLRDYCAKSGVEYMTRSDNKHAKAGNINAAIKRTTGEYFMVLDADFVPQQNFLYRAMGFFKDEKVGIVQIPHNFYNADPMQTNLGMRKVMPDDQRLFFDTIMSCRDAWGAAFCCGSNSITRRSAIESCGGGLPTGSITEDMLLTMALLRNGYVTRYLNERLAIGLAPESLSAMYVQRARWARGAIQILFLKTGPLGPGLRFHHRLMFLPLHWIVQPFMVIMTLTMPAICLWTGWTPLVGASVEEIVSIQFPAVLAALVTVRLLSPKGFFPLASMVHATLQAPRILPTVVTTLIKPHGHAFKVTPKGAAAGGDKLDKLMIFLPISLILITACGLYVNADIDTRIVMERGQIPLIAFWGIISMLILSVVQAVAVTRETGNKEESFETDEIVNIGNRNGVNIPVCLDKISLTSAKITSIDKDVGFHNIRWLRLDLPEIGSVPAFVKRYKGSSASIELYFDDDEKRVELMKKLFTTGLDNSTHADKSLKIAGALLFRIFWRPKKWPLAVRSSLTPPDWLLEQMKTHK